MRLNSRVLVTGAAGGIGGALARGLLAAGATVAAVDQSAAGLAALQQHAQGSGAGARLHTLAADLADTDAAQAVAAQAIDRLGGVDALVNNAGIGRAEISADIFTRPPRFWDVSPALWHRFFAINTHASFVLMCAVLPQMLARGSGRIVNVTTTLESTVRAGGAAYGPSKAALESLTAIAANDLAGTGITVNALLPGGPTDTGMIPANAPLNRATLLRPEVMLPPLLWLLSEAARDVTALRFDASRWDAALPPEQAAALSQAPVAWTSIAGRMRAPQQETKT